MKGFSRRDVGRALALLDVAKSAHEPEGFAESVVDALVDLLPGEIVGYNERDLVSRRLLVGYERPAMDARDIEHAVAMFCNGYPLSMLRRHGDTRALKISDFLSLRELHRLDYYNYALRPVAVEHQLRIWLSAPPATARYFYVSRRREDGDFTERERGLLELLRPFLVSARDRLGEITDVPMANEHGLTDREAEILAWVARGKTNDEIAMLLVVSSHTIRKHLEHAFKKLGVHTRTAAVARTYAHLN